MDTITIRDLTVSCRVGVTDEEQARPQRLLVTIEINHDVSAAAAADDLRQTIDYHAVAQRVLEFGSGRSWRLIETLAVALAEMIRVEFGARQVSVEVQKFVLPEARLVSVRVTRPALS